MAAVPPDALRTRDLLLLAAVGALAAGGVHAAWYAVQAGLLGRLVASSRELPWFAPLAYFLYLGTVAVGLAIVSRVVRLFGTPLVAGTILGGVSAAGMLLHLKVLHPLALLALAAGVGLQLGRWLRRDPAAGLRVARRAAAVLAVVLFAAGVPGILLYRLGQSSQLADLPPARADAPNVVLLILDAVRAANLGTYGYARPTSPTLDRLGSEGVVFETAIATAPWTGPTHASLLTGRYPFFTGVSYVTPLSDSVPSVAEVFRANGYATGAFMGNANWAGRKTGFERGFIRYDDFPVNIWQLLWCATFTQVDLVTNALTALRAGELWRLRTLVRRSELRVLGANYGERNTADGIVRNLGDWQERLDGRPFFAMVNLWDAHDPYRSPFPRRFNDGRRDLDKYDASIFFADSMIGELVNRMQASGTLDRTIFLVTSDHGEQFGEHGLAGHGKSLHLELLHVPLIVRAPGRVPAGQRVPQVVSLRDVPATLLGLAGLSDPRITGRSLASLWTDSDSTDRSPAISEVVHVPNRPNRWPTSYGPMKSLVTDGFHYIRRGDGQERVYAWKGDTTGRGDLTEGKEGVRAIDESRRVLAGELGPRWTDSIPAPPSPR